VMKSNENNPADLSHLRAAQSAATGAGSFAGMIRAPRADDYPRLAELAGQLSYPSTAEQIAQRLAAMAGSAEHAVFVAEMPGGDLAGWVGVFISRGVEVDARGEISGLIVDEGYRSHAVGKHLLARAEEWVRERGCEVVGLRSNVIRDRAHAFYLREGYEHYKTSKTFRKRLGKTR
jgi:GNAT superfamily N-acetyltransferase